MNLDNYMSNQENLPEFMKDFHDQKDLFKTIFEQYKDGNAKKLLEDVKKKVLNLITQKKQ